tara:strand:- start:411 stop:596 length:186 start_codon:yes stop_codon:yes gene_type:complete
MSYWVVGGHYKDTSFKEIKKGFEIEKYGPFKSYEEAKVHWDFHSWKHVDNCYMRYTVLTQK